MKKTLCLTLLVAFLLVSSTVYAGGYGHHGGGYRGYGGGYYGGYGGHGGGYYGHGYYGGYGWNGAYYALGIATAVIGTALIVDAINRPCTTYSYAPHLLLPFTVMVTGKSRGLGYRALRSATGSTSIMTRTVMSGCWGTGRNGRVVRATGRKQGSGYNK